MDSGTGLDGGLKKEVRRGKNKEAERTEGCTYSVKKPVRAILLTVLGRMFGNV